MEKTFCDICGSSKDVKRLILPIYRTFDGCDGKSSYKHPAVSLSSIDICPECLMKSTNIHDLSIMGFGDIVIEQNPELIVKEGKV